MWPCSEALVRRIMSHTVYDPEDRQIQRLLQALDRDLPTPPPGFLEQLRELSCAEFQKQHPATPVVVVPPPVSTTAPARPASRPMWQVRGLLAAAVAGLFLFSFSLSSLDPAGPELGKITATLAMRPASTVNFVLNDTPVQLSLLDDGNLGVRYGVYDPQARLEWKLPVEDALLQNQVALANTALNTSARFDSVDTERMRYLAEQPPFNNDGFSDFAQPALQDLERGALNRRSSAPAKSLALTPPAAAQPQSGNPDVSLFGRAESRGVYDVDALNALPADNQPANAKSQKTKQQKNGQIAAATPAPSNVVRQSADEAELAPFRGPGSGGAAAGGARMAENRSLNAPAAQPGDRAPDTTPLPVPDPSSLTLGSVDRPHFADAGTALSAADGLEYRSDLLSRNVAQDGAPAQTLNSFYSLLGLDDEAARREWARAKPQSQSVEAGRRYLNYRVQIADAAGDRYDVTVTFEAPQNRLIEVTRQRVPEPVALAQAANSMSLGVPLSAVKKENAGRPYTSSAPTQEMAELTDKMTLDTELRKNDEQRSDMPSPTEETLQRNQAAEAAGTTNALGIPATRARNSTASARGQPAGPQESVVAEGLQVESALEPQQYNKRTYQNRVLESKQQTVQLRQLNRQAAPPLGEVLVNHGGNRYRRGSMDNWSDLEIPSNTVWYVQNGDALQTAAEGDNFLSVQLTNSTNVLLAPGTQTHFYDIEQIQLQAGQLAISLPADNTLEVLGPAQTGLARGRSSGTTAGTSLYFREENGLKGRTSQVLFGTAVAPLPALLTGQAEMAPGPAQTPANINEKRFGERTGLAKKGTVGEATSYWLAAEPQGVTPLAQQPVWVTTFRRQTMNRAKASASPTGGATKALLPAAPGAPVPNQKQ